MKHFLYGKDEELTYSDIWELIVWKSEEDQLYILKTMFCIDNFQPLVDNDTIIEGVYIVRKNNKMWCYITDYGLLDFDFHFFLDEINFNYIENKKVLDIFIEEEGKYFMFDLKNLCFMLDSQEIVDILEITTVISDLTGLPEENNDIPKTPVIH